MMPRRSLSFSYIRPIAGRVCHTLCGIGRHLAPLVLFLPFPNAASASEADALAIDANIQAIHLPFGTILDPIFPSPTSTQIIGYTRCGDSAIWTGHYLAAESFRYAVTQSPAALANVQSALAGLKALTDVTGTNLLARCMFYSSSQYAAGMDSEEAANGIYTNGPWTWVGNTSRDQYSGAIFGLAVAYDLVSDPGVKSSAADLITRLVRFLSGNNWSVVMPNGSSSTSFLVRPDQMLAFVQVGRHVNPSQFSTYYDELRILLGPTVAVPVGVDVLTNDSYFKFNLDYINLYSLVRLEGSFAQNIYGGAYDILRNPTASHQNAFFDTIDRALEGANNSARDKEIVNLLDQWLLRPRRDPTVNLNGAVQVCGSSACQPIAVPLRPPDEFLWQESPFQLSGGGDSRVETAGVDYILPYWMARYYGVNTAFTVQSAAASISVLAPNSLGSIYGSNLSATTAQAPSAAWPLSLGGVSVNVTDSAGVTLPALLSYVSSSQINFALPGGVASGAATFTILGAPNGTLAAPGNIAPIAPALFSADGTGSGVAAATAIEVNAGNPQLQGPVQVFHCASTGCVADPIRLGVDTPVFLTLYGTGIRNRSGPANVIVSINGNSFPVQYAGPQPQYPGLDQVNVPLSLNLRGSGASNVILTVDGQPSNTVTINIQ
jgi:uncharacterized protein (TIGR03437 family)